MTRILLHVEKLALHGIRRAERDAFVDSLRGGLERRLAGPSDARLVASRGDRENLAVPSLRLSPAARPAQLGERVAGAIARGLKS